MAPDAVDRNDPLGFVLAESDALTRVEAAYRFCRYEPEVVQKLRHIFRYASAVTGQ